MISQIRIYALLDVGSLKGQTRSSTFYLNDPAFVSTGLFAILFVDDSNSFAQEKCPRKMKQGD